MTLVRTSITISDDLFKEAKELSDNFSSLVTEALREYIRKKAVEKARQSFGKWEKRDTDSIDIVNVLRTNLKIHMKYFDWNDEKNEIEIS